MRSQDSGGAGRGKTNWRRRQVFGQTLLGSPIAAELSFPSGNHLTLIKRAKKGQCIERGQLCSHPRETALWGDYRTVWVILLFVWLGRGRQVEEMGSHSKRDFIVCASFEDPGRSELGDSKDGNLGIRCQAYVNGEEQPRRIARFTLVRLWCVSLVLCRESFSRPLVDLHCLCCDCGPSPSPLAPWCVVCLATPSCSSSNTMSIFEIY